jgi:hypothetical protein
LSQIEKDIEKLNRKNINVTSYWRAMKATLILFSSVDLFLQGMFTSTLDAFSLRTVDTLAPQLYYLSVM